MPLIYSIIDQQQVPIMQSVKLELKKFSHWLSVHYQQVSDYVMNYPFVQYRQMEISATLRRKLTDIISHIITLFSSTDSSYKEKGRNEDYPSCITQNLNCLRKIQSIIEEIRYSFATVQELKTFGLNLVSRQMEEVIVLASILQSSPHEKSSLSELPLSQHTDRSIPLPERGNNQLPRTTEVERTTKIRTVLQIEMTNFLRQRQKIRKSSQQQVHSEGLHLNNNAYKYGLFDRDNQRSLNMHGCVCQDSSQKRRFRPLRKFDYLEEYQREFPSINVKQQAKNELNQTPQRNKFPSVPSTQYQSVSPHRQQLGKELDIESNSFQLQIDSIKQKIPFQALISDIKDKQYHQQEGWEQFQADSLGCDSAEEDNLQDSLEAMKEAESLQKTASFHPPSAVFFQDYSFGQD